jgi:hypothetical protein
MKIASMMAAAIVSSSLVFVTNEANSETMRRFCDAGGSCFVCTRGQPTCEVTYAAVSRDHATKRHVQHARDTAAGTSAQCRQDEPGARLWGSAAFKEHHASANAFAAVA